MGKWVVLAKIGQEHAICRITIIIQLLQVQTVPLNTDPPQYAINRIFLIYLDIVNFHWYR